MPEGDNTYNFTAADIEKYHKGLLSPKEMHAMERAALDDPFLADALDGYGSVNVNASTDIDELENRLQERVDAKVVTMYKRRSFVWLRIAAAIVLISATGLLVYRFGFNNQEKSVASIDNKKAEEKSVASEIIDSSTVALHKTDTLNVNSAFINQTQVNSTYEMPVTDSDKQMQYYNSNPGYNVSTVVPRAQLRLDSTTYKLNYSAVNASPSTVDGLITREKEKEEFAKTTTKEPPVVINGYAGQQRRENAKLDAKAKESSRKDTLTFGEVANTRVGVTDADVLKKAADDRASNLYRNQANYFRGRVLDNNNNALPFANVTNLRDNVGTYADAQGNFTLVSQDSVITVQIHSVGFVNNQATLRNNFDNNLVLQEDKSMNQTVLSNKAFNQKRSRDANIKIEEPEPLDGWPSYDNYIANNVKMPEDIKMKQSEGYVEVSFEVSKNGEPVNIKVEKSLCDQCDKEAIRLIKEGPKWKKKGKKRVTVNVPFIE